MRPTPKSLWWTGVWGLVLAAAAGLTALVGLAAIAAEAVPDTVAPAAEPAADVPDDEQMQQMMRRMEAERRAEMARLMADPAWKPSHEQSAVIRPCPELKGESLHNFCLDRQGNVLAACGGERMEWEVDAKTQEYKSKTIRDPAEVRVFSPDGKRLATFKLEVTPQVLCVGTDGTVFVAGQGQIAKLAPNGKTLAVAESPALKKPEPRPEPEEKKDAAGQEDEKSGEKKEEKKEEKKKSSLLGAIGKALVGGESKGPSAEEQAAMQKAMEEAREQQMREFTGIAATEQDLFVVCPMREGFGYAVWRLDHDLKNPVQIVKNLRGCCGQMDLQAHGGDLWIPVNGEHKVKRYDREGKELFKFGKRDRKSADGFGGCCEPKNLRITADGTVYTAESGPPVAVKRFSPEGKFLGVVALPEFKVGCVRVTVAVSPDAAKVFVLNTGEGAIHVLTDRRAAPTHEALTRIAGPEGMTLNNFCLDAADNLLLAAGKPSLLWKEGAEGQREAVAVEDPGEVRLVSPDGRTLKSVKLPFPAQAIGFGSDGLIYVGGEGRVAKLDRAGQVVLAADSPQMGEVGPIPPLPDPKAEKPQEDEATKKARAEKIEKLKAEAKAAQEEWQPAMKELQGTIKDAKQREETVKKYTAAMQKYGDLTRQLHEASATPESLALEKRQQAMAASSVNGIAVGEQDVFICTREAKGYGFAVWRTDRQFAGAKKIVEGLRGCCGQMDIQTDGKDLWVAENARHRVSHYDRDGKEIAHFGKRDRAAVDGFGGCCEPKNLRFGPDGDIFTCQSGPPVIVQRWSPAGEFRGVVGLPPFSSGCVRVAVGVSKDGGRVYVLNATGNAVEVLADKRFAPTHEEGVTIAVPAGDQPAPLHTICLGPDGNLLAACGGQQVQYVQGEKGPELKTTGTPGQIKVLDPQGKLLKTWEVPLTPEAINVAPDGQIYAAGQGRVARLTDRGKLLKAADAPQIAELPPLPEEKKEEPQPKDEKAEAAKQAQIAELREKAKEAMAALQQVARDYARDRENKDLEKKYQEAAENYRLVQTQVRELTTPPEVLAMQQKMARQRQLGVTGIAVTDQDVFVAVPETKGYGYAVWRMDRNLGRAKKIVEGLRGCCGQMDIQASGGELFVAENARKRVARYDRNGKELGAWGQASRGGADQGFGSCCNPMNVRFGPDGCIYTSEASVGRIMRFAFDGQFLGVVGTAKIVPGCKHVAIAVSDDGERIYLLDITRSQIAVLTKKRSSPPQRAVESVVVEP
jgi:sugar lactone lactonase YvrE